MEHKDVSARTVRESVRRDAGILERASKLKEEGRWFYRSEEEGGIIEDLETPQGPERTTEDVWDHCIEEIVALGQVEVKRPIGAQIASQIASKVQAYWEGQHAKQDKKRVQEEKRLRVLAKQTIKEVTSAWGKIVLVCMSDLLPISIAKCGLAHPPSRASGTRSGRTETRS